jgi:transcriptional regulator with XRE-family HTH domain
MIQTADQRMQLVAERVRVELARRALTGASVARALGMTQRAFSRRYRGEVAFSVPELIAVAELLDLPLEILIGQDAA